MKRRSGTLYEVARDRLGHPGQKGATHHTPDAPPPAPAGQVKVPPGLLAVGSGALVVCALAIWWFTTPTPPPETPRIPSAASSGPPGEIVDPLGAAPEEEPPQEDPRTAGKWYFVLAETRPEGARRLAAFCRSQGLDAAVVSGHNARLERVVALPGLDSASTTTDRYRRLDERIRDVGRRWKAQGHSTDLSDRYLARRKTQP